MRGNIMRGAIDPFQTYVQHLGAGAIATDGVQYSSTATFGTTNAEILNELISPPFHLSLKEVEVSFVQKFEGLNGSLVATMNYYWEMRPEYINAQGSVVTGTYINLSGTLSKAVGTLITSEDTLEGYIPVGSIPAAPVRIRLMASGLNASVATGKVKNNSYVRLVGIVIPGS